MKRNVLEQAADYNKQRRKKVRRYKVFSVLAAFVVFCTTYSLIMPAITMENPKCGMDEHIHSASCYEQKLVCTLDEAGDSSHVHDDSCYDVSIVKEPTCGEIEGGHNHDDSCYTTETITKYKTVTVVDYETVTVEDYDTEDVYDEEGNVVGSQTVLVGTHEETQEVGSHEEEVEDGTEEIQTLSCGQSEGSHTHSDSCYTESIVKELICTAGGHSHDSSCFERTTVCELPEHQHSDACKEEPAETPDASAPENGDASAADGSQEKEEPVDIAEANVPMVDGILGDLVDMINNSLTNEEGYLIDAEGNLVLDENGEPIKVQRTGIAVLPDGAEVPAGYNVEYNFEDSDNGFAVTVYATKDAFPEGSYENLENLELVAELLDEDSDAYAEAADALDEDSYDGMVAMDIRFEIEGIEVEPMAPVYVVINAQGVLPADVDPDSIAIQHHEESAESAIMTMALVDEPDVDSDANVVTVADNSADTGLIEVKGDADMAAAFEVESFSHFTITYKKNSKTASVSVYYYYLNDRGIRTDFDGSTTEIDLSSYPGIEEGILISNLVNEKGLDTVNIPGSGYKYTFVRAEVTTGSNSYSEVYRLKGKYTSGYNKKSELQYSKEETGDSYTTFSSSGYGKALYLIYSREYVGYNYVNDGLAYNNGAGTSNGGLYQTTYDSANKVWWDTGVISTTGRGGVEHADKRHVLSVSMTPSDYLGNPLDGYTSVPITQGNAWVDPAERTASTKTLGDIFPTANRASGDHYQEYRECSKEEATYLYRNSRYYEKDSDTWKSYYKTASNGFYRRWVSTDYYGYSKLQITPEPGYYVTKILVACLNSSQAHPFDCARKQEDVALTAYFDLSTGMNPTLIIRSDAFSHRQTTSGSEYGYYIMIETAAVPSPLFVKYETGKIGDANAETYLDFSVDNGVWLNDQGRETETNKNLSKSATVDKIVMTGKDKDGNDAWADGDLDYYLAGVTGDVVQAAKDHGYRFTGWKIVYYDDDLRNYTGDLESVTFSKPSSSTDNTIKQPNQKTGLVTNAKLIAQWEPIPAAEVVKVVQNMDSADTTIKTYKFKVTLNGDINVTSFKVTTQRYVATGGITVPMPSEEAVAIDLTTKSGTFELEMRGDGTYHCSIAGLPNGSYTVEEIENGGAQKVTGNGQTLDVTNVENETASVTVTNDFKPLPKSFDVTIEKVTPANVSATPDTLNSAIDDAAWSALSGATFEIRNANGTEVIARLTPKNEGGGTATAKAELEPGPIYQLVETEAPAGYNKLSQVIYFKVAENGQSLVLCTSSGTIENVDEEYANIVKAEEDTLTLIVANYGGYVLPSTGGEGTLVYTLAGGMLMACALTVVYKKSLRKEDCEG